MADWLHKYVNAQGREEHVATRLPAYHGCTNLAHTSKARQVKRTQMVATRITIRVFVTLSDCKEPKATTPPRERMWGLNFPYAVIIKICIKK